MVLPAGIAPATVWFEASRADLLRYGSLRRDWKLIRPRATELLLTPSFCRRPAVDSGDGPASKLDAGSGRNWMPHLESHQDLRFQRPSCYCCTTGQMLRMAAKVAWPDYPRAIGPRFIGDESFRWYQRRTWRGAESPDHFLGCIGIKSARVGIFCIHRRKCHRADAFAPVPGLSGKIFVFEAGSRRYRLVLGSMDDLRVVG